MKAKINDFNGKRGKKIETLLKTYGWSYPAQYYDYIDASFLNGNYNQVIELFNDMKHAQQIIYLSEYALDGARMLIERNL